ncbi:MAG: hypothetical protein UR26_C0001G0019 [candidate division TM6 bacterium GW2011_GWF2_32_72]|nr:MAG: hypothetical protein UR26_C0001G0019 [candidate division TM6 bacterium GW2011_GWF2_32_72]
MHILQVRNLFYLIQALFKNKHLLIVSMVVLILMGGCKQKVSSKIKNRKNQIVATPFKIKIDDVECKTCAKLAIKRLKSVSGLASINFVKKDNDFESGYFDLMSLDGPMLDINSIISELAKDGFVPNSIEGFFKGQIILLEDKTPIFQTTRFNQTFLLSEHVGVVDELAYDDSEELLNKEVSFYSILWLDKKTNTFRMTIEGVV